MNPYERARFDQCQCWASFRPVSGRVSAQVHEAIVRFVLRFSGRARARQNVARKRRLAILPRNDNIGATRAQCPKAFIADQPAVPKVDVLQSRAARTQCPKAFIAYQPAPAKLDVLQARAASTQRPKAFIANQPATTNVDVLQARAARTQCPKAFIANQHGVPKVDVLQARAARTQCPNASIAY